eukprot:GHVQ01001447.1.p1 GENE.GHVQ01001447.1~~GHVQ01001447.1.p1  ORF type:complete len:863 (-),score=122.66 GHVQ01001447.1:99-2687(-)
MVKAHTGGGEGGGERGGEGGGEGGGELLSTTIQEDDTEDGNDITDNNNRLSSTSSSSYLDIYNRSEYDRNLHVCFPGCINSNSHRGRVFGFPMVYEQKGSITSDTREECSSMARPALLCVDPESECESVDISDLRCFGATGVCVQYIRTTIAVCISSILLFFFNLAITWLSLMGGCQHLRRSSLKCGIECLAGIFITFVLSILTASVVRLTQFKTYRIGLLLFTWLLVVVADQIKNIIFQSFIWFCVQRRCGAVPCTEVVVSYDRDSRESWVDKIRSIIHGWVDKPAFDIAVNVLISSMITMLSLKMFLAQLLSKKYPLIYSEVEYALKVSDLVLLCFFLVEISLQLIAYGLGYLLDVLNAVDALVVILSFGFTISEFLAQESMNISNALFICRLVKLTRIFRKRKGISGLDKIHFSCPVERVLEIFRRTLETKDLSHRDKDNIEWSMEIISSYKLYSISVDAEKVKDKKQLAYEIQSWIKLTSDSVQDTNWQNNELDNLLLGKLKKKNKTSENDGGVMDNSHSNVMVGIDRSAVKTCESFLSQFLMTWEFDAIKLSKIVGNRALPMTFMACLKVQDLCSLFDITPRLFATFMVELEKGCSTTNPFHNSIHSADVVQAFHLLTYWSNMSGSNNRFIGSQDMLAGLLSCAILSYQHPGLSNSFLTRSQHPVALRYNDKHPLESHQIASAFCLMHSSKVEDPLMNLSEEQYMSVRKMIVRMVIASSSSNYSSSLSMLKTKLSRMDYRSSKGDEKQVLLNNMLRAADCAFCARPLPIYRQWMVTYVEELYAQGDLEKQKGMALSLFCDRNLSATQQSLFSQSFIHVVVYPLYKCIGQVTPHITDHILQEIELNRDYSKMGGNTPQ